MKQYEVRYGTPVNFKVVKTEYRDRAEGVFGTAKRFAEKHNLNWTVSIWNDGYLEKASKSTPPDDGPRKGPKPPGWLPGGFGNHLHIVNEILRRAEPCLRSPTPRN